MTVHMPAGNVHPEMSMSKSRAVDDGGDGNGGSAGRGLDGETLPSEVVNGMRMAKPNALSAPIPSLRQPNHCVGLPTLM